MKPKVFIIFICMSLLFACSNIREISGNIDAPENDAKKYNSYVKLLSDNWLELTAYSYFDTFGTDEKMAVKENFNGFTLGEFPGDKSMYEFHKERLTNPPRQYQAAEPSYGEIDAKMLVLCNKVDSFLELYFKDVNTYYTNKEYKTDNFAKGRELHEKMVSGYLELLNATRDFNIAFYPKMIEQESVDFAKFWKAGFKIHYYSLSVLLTGKEINNMFEKAENEGKSFLEADLAQYEKLYNKFGSNVEELKKIYKDSNQLKNEGYSVANIACLNNFADTAENMKHTATDTLNMIKGGTANIKNKPKILSILGKAGNKIGRDYPVETFRFLLNFHLVNHYNDSVAR